MRKKGSSRKSPCVKCGQVMTLLPYCEPCFRLVSFDFYHGLAEGWEASMVDRIPITARPKLQNVVVEYDVELLAEIKYKQWEEERDNKKLEPKSWAVNREARRTENERKERVKEWRERVKRHLRKPAISYGQGSSSKEISTPVAPAKDPETIHTTSSEESTLQQDGISITESPSVGPATDTRPTPTMKHSEILLSRFWENEPLANLKLVPTSIISQTSISRKSSWKQHWSREEVKKLLTELYGEAEYDMGVP